MVATFGKRLPTYYLHYTLEIEKSPTNQAAKAAASHTHTHTHTHTLTSLHIDNQTQLSPHITRRLYLLARESTKERMSEKKSKRVRRRGLSFPTEKY